MTAVGAPFVRDRLTWMMYFMLAGLAYQQGILGPLMPFLRESLQMSYTMGGVLVTGVALGMILAGLISDRLARRFGRRTMFWAGGIGYVIGSCGLALSPTFPIAFAAVLFNSIASAFAIATVNASLADRHGSQRTRAITEANVAASLSSSVSPLLIGLFQRSGLGWQWALFATILIMLAMAAAFWTTPVPDGRGPVSAPASVDGPLPTAFWAFMLLAILVVAFEWCFIVWGADYLAAVVGLEPATASATMGVFLGAMVLGRLLGSQLARWWPARTLVAAAMAVALVGFPLFWAAPNAVVAITGLFIAGLGVANLFPLSMSLAVGQARDRANTATARVSLGVGVAIFAAPLGLGALADRFSLQSAYAIVPVLGALTVLLLVVAWRKGWQ